MNSSPAPNLFIYPFLMWGQLAWKAVEAVIAGRFAFAGGVPVADDRLALAAMVRQQGETVLESAQAACTRLLALNHQIAALALQQLLPASALASTASSRSVGATAVPAVAPPKRAASTVRRAPRAAKPAHVRARTTGARRRGR